jgi:hypothetical protein
MQWYDWMSIGICLATGIVQAIRGSRAEGMSLPLFEGIGVIVAAVGAVKLAQPLGLSLHVRPWVVMVIVFVVLVVVAFLVARWLFSILAWSFGSLDGFFSFVWGVAAGWAIANLVLHIVIDIQGPTGAVAAVVLSTDPAVRAKAPIANEIVNFRTWNAIMRLLFKAKLGPDFNPDVG